MLVLECSTVCSRDMNRQTEDQKYLKCGYGEQWERSAGFKATVLNFIIPICIGSNMTIQVPSNND